MTSAAGDDRRADLDRWLAIAVDAARIAGDALAALDPAGRAAAAVETRHDVKLPADRHAERLVVDHLRAHAPFAILSEEAGAIAGDGPFTWVVDPLDGTANYWRGIPFCGVSIALLDRGEPVAGVVYDFARREMFTGAAGAGARMNDEPIHVTAVQGPSDAILCTGFPAATDFSPGAVGTLIDAIRAFKKVRLLGSAALSLAYVAAGRADAYFERDIRLWDVAAGLAIVRAAGGRATVTPSRAADHAVTVFAAAPRLDIVLT